MRKSTIIVCNICNHSIPNNSEFCPFCGKKIKPEKNIREGMSKKWILIASFILVAATIFLVYKWQDCEKKLTATNTRLRESSEKIVELNKQLNDSNAEISKLNSIVDLKTTTISSMSEEKESYYRSAREYDDMIEALYGSSTTNGIISTNSEIYCVEKGNTKTIKINWPSYEITQYVGTLDQDIISVDWSGQNLTVKGLDKGVGVIEFSSDGRSKNAYSIVVICY